MPTYDYQCEACSHSFEAFHSIKAAPIKTCPVCGKNKVKRLIGSGGGVIFKGSGFYCTDYRDSSYKSASNKDKPASTDTKTTTETKSTETKTDTKPAAAK